MSVPSVAIALILIAPVAVSAQDSYAIPAHVSAVDGVARIERPGTADADEDLEPNLTLVEGDRVRTRNGRVEILFAGGTLMHLDRDSVVDFQREDFVRVMEGRVRVAIPRDARDVIRVDTPAASLEIEPGGEYRIAVAPNGDAELAVLGGAGAIFNDQGETPLRAGERAVAAAGRAPSQAFYANAAAWDSFDRWSDERRRAHASTMSVRYLPDELRPYGSVFDRHGTWRAHADHGYVWYPVAGSGWQPYARGRWHSYPRYGWTWIGHDAWAWPTHHFGRWGFSAGVWFWIPGRSWSPAWVSWARSPGYIGWSPLGWDNRPLYAIGRRDHRAYSAGYPWCGWSFIRDRHFGGRTGGYIHGSGITVVAATGVAGSAVAPIAPRGRSGTAVRRGGTAVPRTTGSIGSRGSTGSMGSGSIGSRRATPRDGVAAPSAPAGRAIRRPSDSSAAAPRNGASGTSREPSRRAAPRTGATYPYSSAAPGGQVDDAPRARRAPSAPSSSPRSINRRPAESAPAQAPARSRVREQEPRGGNSPARSTTRSNERPSPEPRGGSSVRGGGARGGDSVRSAQPRRAPAPAAGAGGGDRGAVRRAPSGGEQKAAPTSRRPRGGG